VRTKSSVADDTAPRVYSNFASETPEFAGKVPFIMEKEGALRRPSEIYAPGFTGTLPKIGRGLKKTLRFRLHMPYLSSLGFNPHMS
jgi:hypothetical protein